MRCSRLFRLLLWNLAALAVLALLVELGLRLAGVRYPAFYRTDPVRGFAHRPEVQGWWTREGRGWVSINPAGFRDVPHPPHAQPGVLRLAVLADSFGEAFQVNLNDTWWKRLERRINTTPGCALTQAHPGGVEVMNFGVGAYGTGQQLLTWRTDVQATRPDLVLLAMYLGNDIDDNTPRHRPDRPVFRLDPQGELQIDQAFRQTSPFRFRQSWLGRGLDWLVDHSRLAQLLNEAKNRASVQRDAARQAPAPVASIPQPARDNPEGWRVTAALLRALDQEVHQAGARLWVVSLTAPEQVWPDQRQRQAAFAQAGLQPFTREQQLSAILQPLAVPYLPLAPALQRQADAHGLLLHGLPQQQPGIGHWNVTGHRLAAERLAGWLCGR